MKDFSYDSPIRSGFDCTKLVLHVISILFHIISCKFLLLTNHVFVSVSILAKICITRIVYTITIICFVGSPVQENVKIG